MAQIVTDAQRAAFEPYIGEWMRDEFAGTTVTPDDRAEVVAGLRRCYQAAGLPWPDRVVWVPSPDVGEVVAVAAAATARRHRAPGRRRGAVVQWRRATTTVGAFIGNKVGGASGTTTARAASTGLCAAS